MKDQATGHDPGRDQMMLSMLSMLSDLTTTVRQLSAPSGAAQDELSSLLEEAVDARSKAERALAEANASLDLAERALASGEDEREQLDEKITNLEQELRKAVQDVQQERRTVSKLRGDLTLAQKRGADFSHAASDARRQAFYDALKRNGTWAPGFEQMPDDELEVAAHTELDRAAKAREDVTEIVKAIRPAWSRAQLGPPPSEPAELARRFAATFATVHGQLARTSQALDDATDTIRHGDAGLEEAAQALRSRDEARREAAALLVNVNEQAETIRRLGLKLTDTEERAAEQAERYRAALDRMHEAGWLGSPRVDGAQAKGD